MGGVVFNWEEVFPVVEPNRLPGGRVLGYFAFEETALVNCCTALAWGAVKPGIFASFWREASAPEKSLPDRADTTLCTSWLEFRSAFLKAATSAEVSNPPEGAVAAGASAAGGAGRSVVWHPDTNQAAAIRLGSNKGFIESDWVSLRITWED